MPDMDFDDDFEFSIDFGSVKEIPRPPEGDHVLIISEIIAKKAKKEESQGKGFTLEVAFVMDDAQYPDFKMRDFIWVHFDNPFGAINFFEAVTGETLSDRDGEIGKTLNFTKAGLQAYIGEKVGATCENEENNGKTYLKPKSYYHVNAF